MSRLFVAIVLAAWAGLALASLATELAVTVCSQSSGECEDRSVPLEASPLACMLRAQAIVADRPEPGVHIASAHLVGDNDGLAAAADGFLRASEKLLDDTDEPEPRRLM